MNRRKCFLTDAEVLGHLSDRHAGNRDRLLRRSALSNSGIIPGIYAVVITPIEAQRYASVYTDFAR